MSTIECAELFFSSTTATVGEDGLIWKPMLPEGFWKVGPNGRPLKVIAGKSRDPRRAIGMQDIVEAFNEGAVAHVTVPKSHADAVDENTGYVKKLEIRDFNGVPTLFGGHEITDAEIKKKIEEGSIANTSVGLEYDYQRKDNGKTYPVVLRHNALTNRPWLGSRLAPFGVNAAETEDEYEVMSGEFSEPFTDATQGIMTFGEVESEIAEQTGLNVLGMSENVVVLIDGDKTVTKKFEIVDGEVKLSEPDADSSTSDETSTLPEEQLQEELSEMPDAPKNDETPQTPPEPAPLDVNALDLSEHPQLKAKDEENARLRAQVEQLAAEQRERRANDDIAKLKSMGLDEEHGFTGFLKKTREILMSDEGETAILLSEDGTDTPRPVTASTLVRELLDTLPLGEDGKVKLQLSEQATDPLGEADKDKPPVTDENDQLSEDERIAAADAFFDANFPTHA